MSDQLAPASGAMEGRGAYNRHAKHQASGGAMVFPLLEKAVADVPLDGGRPVVIVDYSKAWP